MSDISAALGRFPRIELTRTPTPLQRLDHLSEQLGGPEIWMKRDDLTDLALGGDKPRKLEYELARAVAEGADTLVTSGSAQSNFARLTAAAARRLGMRCALVLSRDRHPVLQGNLLVVSLLGAEYRLVDTADHWGLEEDVEDLCRDLRRRGRRPYLIPVSGTTPISCLGYVRAGFELAAQMREVQLSPDAIYTPFGTGGIFTALLFSLRDAGYRCPMVGVSVNRKENMCRQQQAGWWQALSDLLGGEPGLPPGDYQIQDGYIGAGYGDPTPATLEAICTLAATEGILADPVYSGKVVAGLIDHVRGGRWKRGDRVLLVHSGGVPAIFAYHEELAEHLARSR